MPAGEPGENIGPSFRHGDKRGRPQPAGGPAGRKGEKLKKARSFWDIKDLKEVADPNGLPPLLPAGNAAGLFFVQSLRTGLLDTA